MKLTTRCGTAAVDGLNETLLAKAAQAKLLRTSRVRADATVVPTDVDPQPGQDRNTGGLGRVPWITRAPAWVDRAKGGWVEKG